MSFSITERAKVAAWFEWTKSISMVQTKFRGFGRIRNPPTEKTIHKWHASLMENGSVIEPKRRRSLSAMLEYRERLYKVTEMDGGHVELYSPRPVNSLSMKLCDLQCYWFFSIVL